MLGLFSGARKGKEVGCKEQVGSCSIGSRRKRMEGRIAEEGGEWKYFLGGSLNVVSDCTCTVCCPVCHWGLYVTCRVSVSVNEFLQVNVGFNGIK